MCFEQCLKILSCKSSAGELEQIKLFCYFVKINLKRVSNKIQVGFSKIIAFNCVDGSKKLFLFKSSSVHLLTIVTFKIAQLNETKNIEEKNMVVIWSHCSVKHTRISPLKSRESVIYLF